MSENNFFAELKARFQDRPERVFLRLPDGRIITYGDIDHLSAAFAGALLNTGAKAGDRVVAQIEKSPENVALYLGAMRAGLVYVPLNTAYTAEEIDYFLSDAAPSIFVCAPDNEDNLSAIATKAGVKKTFTLGANQNGSIINAANNAMPFDDIHPRHADDLAVILYTSGTTGRSKGAMLSHENLSSNANTLNSLWGFTSKDVLLHALPIFHIHGLFVALHVAMLGACEILFLPKFDVAEVRRYLRDATVMMGVPTFYTRLLAEKDFGPDDAKHMRLFISGSAPLTEETFNGFEARSGHKILERYGMSEAGMIASNPLDGDRVAGTVGYALDGVNLRVTDDNGLPAPINQPGNVEVKGPNIFKGYWRNPEKTKEEFTGDGYFKTGDIGALDEAGRLTLSGRSKDLIIAGGYNIYPKEIEAVLDAVPGVSESTVIGVPHPDMGEGVIAVLVAEKTPVEDATLQNAISSLAKFKRPRKIFWIDELPRNAMGKVQKQILREKYQGAF
ncbi:MAG: malonyl-CoA synthase [Hyphococcus sp.]|nr:MAG: malonyl-CoA synthase [Marinicaulis sp.]